MPLKFLRKINKQTEIGVWRLEENLDWFEKRLHLSKLEEVELSNMIDRRKREGLAARYLLHQLSGRTNRLPCTKDEFGKPHLIGSNHQVSISHSDPYAAVIASPTVSGIDIQKIVPKIGRIKHKFLSDSELNSIEDIQEIVKLHIYWGAKECLYKAYGKKRLEFSKHLYIHPFKVKMPFGELKGEIKINQYHGNFQLFYQKIEDYILVYGMEY